MLNLTQLSLTYITACLVQIKLYVWRALDELRIAQLSPMTARSASSSPSVVWHRYLRWMGSGGQHRRVRDLRNRAWSRIRQLDVTYDAQMAGEAIVLAREAHELSSESEADRLDACLLLAESLLRQVNRQEDDSMLDEMITFGREALAISPERHSSRARSCRNLAISL
jgi:hypothetical protein